MLGGMLRDCERALDPQVQLTMGSLRFHGLADRFVIRSNVPNSCFVRQRQKGFGGVKAQERKRADDESDLGGKEIFKH